MWLLARLEADPGNAERRSAHRRKLHLETEGSGALQKPIQVVIHDLTPEGFLMESTAAIAVGDRLEVAVPEAGAVEATAVWKSGSYCGCKFSRPISTAAVSAAILRSYPSAPQETPSETLSKALVELEALADEIRRITFVVDRALTRLAKRDRT
jgi:hypothetical protein